MAASHDWGSTLRLGCHHLAAGFAGIGCDVAYISPAISPMHLVRDPRDFLERVRRWRSGGVVSMDGRLWAHTPLSMLTPHNAPVVGGRRIHRNWHRLTVPNVIREVRNRGFEDVDLLYIDSPTQAFWLDHTRFGTSVVRIGDRLSGFTGMSPQVLELQRELVQRADLVVCSSGAVCDDLRQQGADNVMVLPNGVDYAHFATADRTMPVEYASMPKPIVIYVGEMAEWFDYQLMNRLARSMPGVSFVLVGPDKMARARLAAHDNVHVLGRRSFDEIPRYLWNADVGIIPFDVANHGELVHAVHPLKIYEYLACGLPVVATRWDELERLASPAALCDSLEDFVSAIDVAILGPSDPAAGQTFARQADWSGRVMALLARARVTDPTAE